MNTNQFTVFFSVMIGKTTKVEEQDLFSQNYASFKVGALETNNNELSLFIYDVNGVNKSVVGETTVDISPMTLTNELNGWYTLFDSNHGEKPVGQIMLKIRCTNSPTPHSPARREINIQNKSAQGTFTKDYEQLFNGSSNSLETFEMTSSSSDSLFDETAECMNQEIYDQPHQFITSPKIEEQDHSVDCEFNRIISSLQRLQTELKSFAVL